MTLLFALQKYKNIALGVIFAVLILTITVQNHIIQVRNQTVENLILKNTLSESNTILLKKSLSSQNDAVIELAKQGQTVKQNILILENKINNLSVEIDRPLKTDATCEEAHVWLKNHPF